MRLVNDENSITNAQDIFQFSNWILKIDNDDIDDGDGDYLIEFPSNFIIIPQNDAHNDIIQNIYFDLSSKLLDREYLNERAILAPINKIVDVLNEIILSSISAEEVVYLSADLICKTSSNYAEEDLLYLSNFLIF